MEWLLFIVICFVFLGIFFVIALFIAWIITEFKAARIILPIFCVGFFLWAGIDCIKTPYATEFVGQGTLEEINHGGLDTNSVTFIKLDGKEYMIAADSVEALPRVNSLEIGKYYYIYLEGKRGWGMTSIIRTSPLDLGINR